MNILKYFSIPGFFNAPLAVSSIPRIMAGFPLSIILTVVSFFLSLVIGLFLTLAQLNKHRWIHWLARAYISFMRGVPMIVVLFVIYFGFKTDALPAAIISFTIVSSAFVSEVFRSSFIAIDRGQWEAARSLGLSYMTTIRSIIFPQAFRISIPALGNILLDQFKSTSLAAMITVGEMFMQAQIVAGANQDYMSIYLTIAVIYWFFCTLLTAGQNVLEQHLTYPH